MFAIVENGSRQHRVTPGLTFAIDYMADSSPGDTVTFDRILLANGGGASKIGQPLLEGATVEAEVAHPLTKGPKLEVQKNRRRKNSRTHTGHRQKHTTVKVTAINVPGLEIVESAEPTPEESPAAATTEPVVETPIEEPTAEESGDATTDEN
ncbi:MAG: 50S ribosomal protein L21 [Planctomycetota bacterium]|nr:50S ribosomal protein L21 [Planctomycetota bacterium]